MNRLRNIEIFIEVARARSFTVAARRLGISRATATKHVLALETGLGARLLNRSTQHVGLTEAGRTFLEHASQILDQLERLSEDVAEVTADLRGLIRVGTPPSFGTSHFVPAMNAFRAKHPDVEFALTADDGVTDLIKEGFDLSLRIAPELRDVSHIAQLLVRVAQVLVASPGYLARKGEPRAPEDLAGHDCLIHSLKAPVDIWTFNAPEAPVSLRVRGPLRADFGEALRQAAILGEGISMHPTYMVHDDIRSGRLQVVLPRFRPERLDIYAVYPQRRYLPRRVRCFIAFLKQWLQDNSAWSQDQTIEA
jgi:DNA-binding transcriptional LysR family regulator